MSTLVAYKNKGLKATPRMRNPYLVSLHTAGKNERPKLDVLALEQFFCDNGAMPFYKELKSGGWLSRTTQHSVLVYMSDIPDEILQQSLSDEPRTIYKNLHSS